MLRCIRRVPACLSVVHIKGERPEQALGFTDRADDDSAPPRGETHACVHRRCAARAARPAAAVASGRDASVVPAALGSLKKMFKSEWKGWLIIIFALPVLALMLALVVALFFRFN